MSGKNQFNNTDIHKKYHYKPDLNKLKPYDQYKGISNTRLLKHYNSLWISVLCGKYELLPELKEISYYLSSTRNIDLSKYGYIDNLIMDKSFNMDLKGNIQYHIGLKGILSDNEIIPLCDIPIGYNNKSRVYKKYKSIINDPPEDLKPITK